MILEGTTPKELSRAGRCAVLALAAVLLPLWPTAGRGQERQPRAPAAPADEDADPTGDGDREKQIRDAQITVEKLHKQVADLQAQVRTAEKQLRDAQNRLDNVWGRNPRPQPRPANAAPKPETVPLAPNLPRDTPTTKREFTRRSEGANAPGGDYERRLRAVEQKLDQLLEELSKRRESRPDYRPSKELPPSPSRRS